MRIDVLPRRAGIGFALAISALAGLSVAGQLWKIAAGPDSLHGLVRFVHVDSEQNLPTAYQFVALLATAGLLLALGAVRTPANLPRVRYWQSLGMLFLFLACDEMFRVHERLRGSAAIQVSNDLRELGPLFKYRWLVYGIPFVLIAGFAYVRFVARLPARVRGMVFAGGIMFVAGALGLEMVGGAVIDSFGRDGIAYALCSTVEEVLEMAGVATFFVALMTYVRHELRTTAVTIDFQIVRGPVLSDSGESFERRAV